MLLARTTLIHARAGSSTASPWRLAIGAKVTPRCSRPASIDIALPCPFDPECDGQAWAPAYSVSCLFRALTGAMDNDPDIVCTVHGDGVDQEADDHYLQDDDPEGRADLEAQYADAVRA